MSPFRPCVVFDEALRLTSRSPGRSCQRRSMVGRGSRERRGDIAMAPVRRQSPHRSREIAHPCLQRSVEPSSPLAERSGATAVSPLPVSLPLVSPYMSPLPPACLPRRKAHVAFTWQIVHSVEDGGMRDAANVGATSQWRPFGASIRIEARESLILPPTSCRTVISVGGALGRHCGVAPTCSSRYV